MPLTQRAIMLLAVPAGAVHLSQLKRGNQSGDDCGCLKWKEVYSQNYAACGAAFEYWSGESKGLPHQLAEKYLKTGYCDEFFTKLDDNECVNMAHDSTPGTWWTDKTWCWTANGCNQVSEIEPDLYVHAKVKFCGESDLSLNHFLVEDLFGYADAQDMDLGLTVKMAYRVSHTLAWDNFKETYLAKHCGDFNASKKRVAAGFRPKGRAVAGLEADLKSVLAAESPDKLLNALILVNDGIPPFGLITNSSIYEVFGSPPADVDHAHPNTESFMVCLCGGCLEEQ